MAKLAFKQATTSKIVRIKIYDSSQSDNRGLTALVFNTSGLTAYYIREGDATATAITLVTATVGTWTSSGFIQIDATNMPGWYELHLPNAALASGKSVGVQLKGATNMMQVDLEIELEAVDNQDTVRYGLTALPNVVAGANGGLPTGNASGQVAVASFANNAITAAAINADAITAAKVADGTIDAATFAAGAINAAAIAADAITAAKVADGTIDAATFAAGAINAAAIASNAITSAKIATDAIGAAQLATDAVTEIQTAVAAGSVASVVGAVGSVTGNVGGNVTGSVGSVASGGITAASIAASAITAAKIATDAIGAAQLAADAVTEIQTAVAAGAVASVTGAVGSVTGNVGGNVIGSVGSVATGGITAASIASNAITSAKIATDAIGAAQIATDAVTEIAAGVWDRLTSALTTVGSIGKFIVDGGAPPSAATIAAAVWDRLTSALSTSGSIGKLLVDNIDAAISSRLASGSYTAPPSAATISSTVWAESVRALTDKAGFALSSAGVQAIWDALTSALTTVGSVGKRIADDLDTTISSRNSVAPDNASITAIKAKTDNLPASPAAVGSVMQVDVTQALANSPAIGTVGYALVGSEVQSGGDWVLAGTVLTLKRKNGTTFVTFNLDSATDPTQRIAV